MIKKNKQKKKSNFYKDTFAHLNDAFIERKSSICLE